MQEAFHYDLTGRGCRYRRVHTGSEQCHRKQRRGNANPQHRRQQLIGLLDLLVVRAVLVEDGDSCDQDAGLDEQGKHQGDGAVGDGPAKG
jgi:hypothetical protein